MMTKQRSIVADRIEELLRIKNISVADLSRASGVSEGSLSKILSGIRKHPRSDTVQKIADAFPTSSDYLYGKTDHHEPSNAPPLPKYAADVLEFMRQIDSSRNYELWLIARTFADEHDAILKTTYTDLIDAILDMADERDEAETDFIVRYLTELERQRIIALSSDSIPGHPDK